VLRQALESTVKVFEFVCKRLSSLDCFHVIWVVVGLSWHLKSLTSGSISWCRNKRDSSIGLTWAGWHFVQKVKWEKYKHSWKKLSIASLSISHVHANISFKPRWY
jgi:hypothetical protein